MDTYPYISYTDLSPIPDRSAVKWYTHYTRTHVDESNTPIPINRLEAKLRPQMATYIPVIPLIQGKG